MLQLPHRRVAIFPVSLGTFSLSIRFSISVSKFPLHQSLEKEDFFSHHGGVHTDSQGMHAPTLPAQRASGCNRPRLPSQPCPREHCARLSNKTRQHSLAQQATRPTTDPIMGTPNLPPQELETECFRGDTIRRHRRTPWMWWRTPTRRTSPLASG